MTGSWFVLERWISETPFRSAIGHAQSDLDVARGPNAQQVLEQHWDTWITESDWTWIADKGLNSVRIPVRADVPLRLVIVMLLNDDIRLVITTSAV